METNKVLKLVEKNTSSVGEFSITFNEHRKSTTYDMKNNVRYQTSAKDYYGLDDEDVKDNSDVDWNGNIYNFHWYNITQVGFYSLFSNTFEGLIKKIQQLLEELK